MEARPVSMPAAGHPGRGDSPWATRRIAVGGATIRLATVGEGPPLLLLNGIGGNIEMWEPVACRLPGRRLFMLNLPGSGDSPPLMVPLRMAGYARLLLRLLDQLKIDRVDVLGYSWGGALAQQLALTAPSRVRPLVLVATMPGLGGQPPAPWVIALMATPGRYYSRTHLRLVAPLVFGSDPAGADRASGEGRRRRPPFLGSPSPAPRQLPAGRTSTAGSTQETPASPGSRSPTTIRCGSCTPQEPSRARRE